VVAAHRREEWSASSIHRMIERAVARNDTRMRQADIERRLSNLAIDTDSITSPIVGFIFDQKGLMYNLTLEGSKISRIDR
jgi:hypothetical protein